MSTQPQPDDTEAFPAVESLIPHGPPMRRIDAITAWDGETLVCSLEVRDDDPFADDGAVPASACLEYIAQACAVHASLRREGGAQQPGYLMGCRQLELLVDGLAVGDRLQITVRETGEIGGAAMFEGRVARGEEPVARGVLSVILGAEARAS
ncbi:MAG: hypothetical protein KC636_34735 [Myxococcales bacterium]|nr:hypothetical protein [Myxococcales bacterium]